LTSLGLAEAFRTDSRKINNLVLTVDQEVGGSNPPSCTYLSPDRRHRNGLDPRDLSLILPIDTLQWSLQIVPATWVTTLC
jgi:hypothetical protein